MGNRDKEFMDNIRVDLRVLPSKLSDPEREYDQLNARIGKTLSKPTETKRVGQPERIKNLNNSILHLSIGILLLLHSRLWDICV